MKRPLVLANYKLNKSMQDIFEDFLVSFCVLQKESDLDILQDKLWRDGHSRFSAPLLNYADFVQLPKLMQSLCRLKYFRNFLCFKKLTSVSI